MKKIMILCLGLLLFSNFSITANNRVQGGTINYVIGPKFFTYYAILVDPPTKAPKIYQYMWTKGEQTYSSEFEKGNYRIVVMMRNLGRGQWVICEFKQRFDFKHAPKINVNYEITARGPRYYCEIDTDIEDQIDKNSRKGAWR